MKQLGPIGFLAAAVTLVIGALLAGNTSDKKDTPAPVKVKVIRVTKTIRKKAKAKKAPEPKPPKEGE